MTDPYLWTLLARYGGALVLCVMWAVVALVQLRRRRSVAAVAFAATAVVVGWGVGTHVVPVLAGTPLPEEPWALDVALRAPFAGLALVVLARSPAPRDARLDGWSLVRQAKPGRRKMK